MVKRVNLPCGVDQLLPEFRHALLVDVLNIRLTLLVHQLQGGGCDRVVMALAIVAARLS